MYHPTLVGCLLTHPSHVYHTRYSQLYGRHGRLLAREGRQRMEPRQIFWDAPSRRTGMGKPQSPSSCWRSCYRTLLYTLERVWRYVQLEWALLAVGGPVTSAMHPRCCMVKYIVYGLVSLASTHYGKPQPRRRCWRSVGGRHERTQGEDEYGRTAVVLDISQRIATCARA